MDSNQFTAVDFLADETFLNYVNKTVEKDIVFWQNYIDRNPDKVDEINIAKLMLNNLSANKNSVATELANFKEKFNQRQSNFDTIPYLPTQKSNTNFFKYASVIAIVLFVGGFAFFKFNLKEQIFPVENKNATEYKTDIAQRKKIILEDGTSVLLNAGSKIALRNGFNVKMREVDLVGEAYFEVAHNAAVPFIVHTNKINVKVLGTVFNVKAYPDEAKTEATLISGKIEATFNDKSQKKIILKPSEKVTVINASVKPANNKQLVKSTDEIKLSQVSINTRNAIVETVWVNNGLEINNETFVELQQKLEREYGVKIVFKDKEVMNYKFTATLKDEPINEVLKAMKTVNHFNYKIYNNSIEVSK